jgi:AcrR family transcriptional regulator
MEISMERKTSKKYNALIASAKELFFKYGVKRVTLKEICEHSNVSKVTFYSYFKDKNEIVAYIRNELTEAGFSKFDQINTMDISYIEKIEMMTQWRVDFFSSMTDEFIEEIIDVNEIQSQIKKRYLDNIKAAQDKGKIDKNLDPEIIWLVTEKFNEIVKEGKWRNKMNGHIDLQKQLRQIYFYGLLNNK